MPKYNYRCESCGAVFESEAPIVAAADPSVCPVCGDDANRQITPPKLLFKSDPSENRPYWHNHNGYSHSHAPRRGRHRTSEEDH